MSLLVEKVPKLQLRSNSYTENSCFQNSLMYFLDILTSVYIWYKLGTNSVEYLFIRHSTEFAKRNILIYIEENRDKEK